MRRTWLILATLLAVAGTRESFAQPAASPSLAQRLGLTGRPADQSAAAMHYDPQVRPAAAATQTQAKRRPMAPRDMNQRGGTGKSGGTLFSKIHLPNLFGGPSADNDSAASQPPLPYDPAELNGRGPSKPNNMQRPPQARSAQPQQQTRRPAQQATGAPKQDPIAATARMTPRSSPKPSARHNELAEALSGLGSGNQAPPAVEEQTHAQTGDALPPVVSDEADLPSYLRNSGAKAAPAARASGGSNSAGAHRAAVVRSGPQTVDLNDALAEPPAPRQQVPPAPPRLSSMKGQAAASSSQSHASSTVPQTMGRLAATRRQPSTAAPVQGAPRDLADVLAPKGRQVAAAQRPAPTDSAATLGKIAAQPTPPVKMETPAPATPTTIVANPRIPAKPVKSTEATAAKGYAESTPADSAAASQITPTAPVSNIAGLLMNCSQPMIESRVEGPQRAIVGRPTQYRVTLSNTGTVVASDVIATIEAPTTADIADASASGGVVERAASEDGAAESAKVVKWQLYELQPGAEQTLSVEIIPRSGRDMHLSVRWTHAAVGGEATVELEEPKLHMEISGPNEVLYGKSQRYALTLANPGTGAAEDVAIELLPPGGDENSIVRHSVGTLAAGETKKIELELTAREAGELRMHASATATGDLKSEAEKIVLCRRPGLEVDWRGPDKQYAGAVATYFLRVRNPGTATADDVKVRLQLPTGAELVDASEGFAFDEAHQQVTWTAAGLNAGDERFMQVRCRFVTAGVNNIELSAQTADGITSSATTAAVAVVALADLKLDVVDPKGAVPVGETAVYEIRIKNRGTTAARGVNVVAMFSEGIDPTRVEGGPHTIKNGRVAFRTIDNLAAGAEAVLRIQAVAGQEGTHVFRAEVVCDDIETKLAAEETTRFFTEDSRWNDASTAYRESGETTSR